MELLVEFSCPYIAYDSVGAKNAVMFGGSICNLPAVMVNI
jgi:hypothetical protein